MSIKNDKKMKMIIRIIMVIININDEDNIDSKIYIRCGGLQLWIYNEDNDHFQYLLIYTKLNYCQWSGNKISSLLLSL